MYTDFLPEDTNYNITIDHPKGRTYGECIYDELSSIQMIEGRFITTLHIKDKPKRMTRCDALHYYTQKLRRVWENTQKDLP